MKTNKLIESAALLALTIVAGCGLRTWPADTSTISAYRLAAEEIPVDDVILAQAPTDIFADAAADAFDDNFGFDEPPPALTAIADPTLPLAPPRCVSLYALSHVYAGHQTVADLEIENPMHDSISYIFNEIDQNQMVFTAGNSILWTAPSVPGVYRIVAVAKNSYGECSREVSIIVGNEKN